MTYPRGRRLAGAVSISVWSLAACNDPAAPSSPHVTRSLQRSAALQTSPPPGRVESIDEQFARLGAGIPGFGGYVYDPEGNMVVFLNDTVAHGAVARQALEAVLRGRGHVGDTANPQPFRRACCSGVERTPTRSLPTGATDSLVLW